MTTARTGAWSHICVDPVHEAVRHVLDALATSTGRLSESALVDFKEEARPRQHSTDKALNPTRQEHVAKHLAGEAACFANTPGGGALIVGVADDGALLGALADGRCSGNNNQ